MASDSVLYEKFRIRREDLPAHLFFWFIYFVYLIWGDYYQNPFPTVLLDSVIYLLITSSLVYTNIIFLIPPLLYKGRNPAYLAFFIALILGGSTMRYGVYTFFLPSTELRQFPGLYVYFSWFFKTGFEVAAISSLKIIQDRISTKENLQTVENKRFEAELKFLKAQMSPHFLFNTLNNIYFLIRKDPSKASDSVLKLSEILRFRLYGTNDSKILLEGEIKYIRNYIELELLRYESRLTVDLVVDGGEIPFLVEPFFFLDFVENAFKHNSILTDTKGWIKIKFVISKSRVDFQITNSCETLDEDEERRPGKKGGIGMPNIKQRLQLLYPDKHELKVEKNAHIFSVSLSIFP
jgi:two-component system LytT family sensor kinase